MIYNTYTPIYDIQYIYLYGMICNTFTPYDIQFSYLYDMIYNALPL